MAEAVKEMLKFLQIPARLDLKAVALSNVLGLTGSTDGIKLLCDIPDLLISLATLLYDNSETISKDAALCLVNISANEKGFALLDLNFRPQALLVPPRNIIVAILTFILDTTSHIADPCCMILSNLTRNSRHAEKAIDFIEESDVTFDNLINAFTKIKYNEKGATLHYLGPVLSNLSQSPRVRRFILNKERCVVQKLLAFTEYEHSTVRRGGVVGTLKNCCFESDVHGWLLGADVDILPRLLLPLAGDTEYDDEDNEKLPMELQYLAGDKQREQDPDIRCMLLESITQLCAKRVHREYIRDKNAYVILRELHKWESDSKALLACENLVDIIIRTEEEIGEDNLKDLDIPDDVMDKLKKMDASNDT